MIKLPYPTQVNIERLFFSHFIYSLVNKFGRLEKMKNLLKSALISRQN
jgi:hypothetical protein